MKALKAYEVREPYEGHCVIQFATSNAAARREGAAALDTDWEGVESCQRAPWFDQYAPGPVPPMALLDAGWWYECTHCGRRVELACEDEEDEDGNPVPPLQPQVMGAAVFCGMECHARYCARRRANDAATATLCELVYLRWPEAQIVRAHVYGDRLEPPDGPGQGWKSSAVFSLPSLQYPVTYNFGDAGHLWVAQGDQAAFAERYS